MQSFGTATGSPCCRRSAADEVIALSPSPIDAAALAEAFGREVEDAGAIATFTGIVRRDGGKDVEALYLDHAPGMTERAIRNAVDEAKARWPLVRVEVVHRIGKIPAGEAVVFVAAAAAHRRAAFEACDFLVDFLKTDAPFWKKQISRTGEEWIEPRAEDYDDRGRWR